MATKVTNLAEARKNVEELKAKYANGATETGVAVEPDPNPVPAEPIVSPAPLPDPQPLPQVAAEPVQPVVQPEPVIPVSDEFEKKYKTLMGKYKAETKQQEAVIATLQQQLAEVSEQVKAITDEKAKSPKPELTPTVEDYESPIFSVEDASEIANIADKKLGITKSINALSQEIASIRQEMANVSQNLTSVSSTTKLTREEQIQFTLDSLSPKWRELDRSQDFWDWAEITPISDYSPVSIKARINEAYNAGTAEDVQVVAKIFNDYLATQKPVVKNVATEIPQPIAQPVAQPIIQPENPLLNHVVPDTLATQPIQAKPPAETYKKSEVDAMLVEMARKPQNERHELMEKIKRAYAEGRVLVG